MTGKKIQDALDKHRKVKLPAGTTITITEPIYIPEGRKLYSDPANPATIRRTADVRQRMLVVDGRKAKIAHIIQDFNFANGWEEYVIAIAFSAEEFTGRAPQEKSGARIYNVKFIDSNGVVVHPISATGDSWCVSFATDFTTTIQSDIAVVGCNCTAEYHQLTANGQGLGQDQIVIAHNRIQGSFGTGIAISSRTDPSTMTDITIRHNFVLDARAFGIFVGQDTQEVIFIDLNLDGILIEKNYVSHSDFRQFITSFVIRSGLAGGQIDNCVIQNNISDATKSAALEPRTVSYQSDTAGSDLQFIDNKSIGFARSVLINADLTESGNTYYDDGGPWSLSDIAQP